MSSSEMDVAPTPAPAPSPRKPGHDSDPEEEDDGDWYPGKPSTDRALTPSPQRLPSFEPTVEGHAIAVRLFETYVRRRFVSLEQITRAANFFDRRAEDSKTFAANVTKSNRQLVAALPPPAPASNAHEEQPDSIFIALDALMKNTAEVQNQHESFAASVTEDVVQPLREATDKFTTTLQPGLQKLHELRRLIDRSQKHTNKLLAKANSLDQLCDETRLKLSKIQKAEPVSMVLNGVEPKVKC